MLCRVASGQEVVHLNIDADQVVNRVDEKIYGHFLEHIYHSCNGGLWGELVWNRSFEQNASGQWMAQDDCIVQTSLSPDVRLTFGDSAWSDYQYTLQARKEGGSEGFLILLRVQGPDDFYWVNLGGWNNQRHGLERGRSGEGRWHTVGPVIDGSIERDHWYTIRARCEGSRLQVWLDDQQVIDFTDDEQAHLRGKVGIGTWSTQARFRNLKVTDLEGRVLYQGLPAELSGPAVANSWSACGTGQVYLDMDSALNGRFSQRLINQNGETGIQQAPLCIRQGEVYRGSLWTRGRAESLSVALMDKDQQVAQAVLSAAD